MPSQVRKHPFQKRLHPKGVRKSCPLHTSSQLHFIQIEDFRLSGHAAFLHGLLYFVGFSKLACILQGIPFNQDNNFIVLFRVPEYLVLLSSVFDPH